MEDGDSLPRPPTLCVGDIPAALRRAFFSPLPPGEGLGVREAAVRSSRRAASVVGAPGPPKGSSARQRWPMDCRNGPRVGVPAAAGGRLLALVAPAACEPPNLTSPEFDVSPCCARTGLPIFP